MSRPRPRRRWWCRWRIGDQPQLSEHQHHFLADHVADFGRRDVLGEHHSHAPVSASLVRALSAPSAEERQGTFRLDLELPLAETAADGLRTSKSACHFWLPVSKTCHDKKEHNFQVRASASPTSPRSHRPCRSGGVGKGRSFSVRAAPATGKILPIEPSCSGRRPVPSRRRRACCPASACTNGRRWRNRMDIAGRVASAAAADRRAPGRGTDQSAGDRNNSTQLAAEDLDSGDGKAERRPRHADLARRRWTPCLAVGAGE